MAYTDVEYKFKSIGKNVQIGKNVYFRYPEEVEIGNDVIIDEFCYFTTKVKLGNNIHIAPFCSVIGGKSSEFIMEDYSGFAAGVRVICSSDDFVNGPFTNPTIPVQFRPNCKMGKVKIEKHAVVGTNSIIMPNVTLKEGSAVGVMSLIKRSTIAWKVYIGNPAKPVLERNKESILEGEKQYLEYLNNKESEDK